MLAKKLISLALCLVTGVSNVIIAHAQEPESKPQRIPSAETQPAGAKNSDAAGTNEVAAASSYFIYIYDSATETEFAYVDEGSVVKPIAGLSWNAQSLTLTMNNFVKKTYQIFVSCDEWSGQQINLVTTGSNELCFFCSYEPVKLSGGGTLSVGRFQVDDFEMTSGILNINSEYLKAYYYDYPTDIGVDAALYSPYGDETNLFKFNGGIVNISGDYDLGIDQYAGNIEIRNTEINIDIPKYGSWGLSCGYDEDGIVSGGNLSIFDSRVFIRTSMEAYLIYCYDFNAGRNLYYYSGKNKIQKAVAPEDFLVSADWADIPFLSRSTEDFPSQNCLLISDEFQFADVADPAKYYYDPVYWAYSRGITTGTSPTTFSPDDKVTRGAIVTFLYRTAGEPDVSDDMPFTDVKKGAYYEDAVKWAVELDITTGTSPTTFSPNEPCTRAQIVTFLYRFAYSPEVGTEHPFKDVKPGAFYEKPVIWAVENNITTGTSATTFSPNETCNRAQAVTFLYRVARMK